MSPTDHLNRHHGRWAALAAALTLSAVPFLLRLEVDNSIDQWIDREAEDYATYREFLDAFGSEEYVLVVYKPPKEIDLPFLERLTDLRFSLEELDGVKRAQCISGVFARSFGLLGIEAFRRELSESPLYRNVLISPDGLTAAIWIELEGREEHDRSRLVAQVRTVTREVSPELEVYLAGSPVIDEALDQGSRRASLIFFPLVFLLSALLLLLFFRRPYGVAIPFLSVGPGIAWTLALPALSGRALNMVTVTLPPLLWVLGLSTSIHLLSRCSRLLGAGIELDQAVSRASREVFRPCAMSAVTTALGFASLMTSSMQPVRDMGRFASLGILLCLAANFLLFPHLARVWPPHARTPSTTEHPLLGALAGFLPRRAGRIVALAGVLGLALLLAILRIRAESNPIRFFKDDSPIAVTHNEILADFTGPYSVEVLLTPGDRAATLDVFLAADRLGQHIAELPQVAKVISAVDLIKKAHQRSSLEPPAFHRLPTDEAAFGEALYDAGQSLEEELSGFFDAAGGTLRLSVLGRPMGSSDHRRLLEEIRASFALVDPIWRPRLTGIVPLLVEIQERLLTSQLKSFAIAFIAIGVVIALLLRSARYAAITLVPNLIPIAIALGTMGLLGIALDPATIMIAGVALGIAVDDTIHFLEHYLGRRRSGADVRAAVDQGLRNVGQPMVLTSAVAATGFFSLCFSDFKPLFYFGLLTGIAMGAALVAALLVLPALLLLADGSSGR